VTVYASRLWLETRQRVHPGLQKRYLRMLRHDLPNPLERLGGGSPVELVGPGDAEDGREPRREELECQVQAAAAAPRRDRDVTGEDARGPEVDGADRALEGSRDLR
jgi:hypothetical protein